MCGFYRFLLLLTNNYSCFIILCAGQVYSLGRREYGRLGLGEDCQDVAEPTLIAALKDKKVVGISCEGNVSYAVTDDGTFLSFSLLMTLFLSSFLLVLLLLVHR